MKSRWASLDEAIAYFNRMYGPLASEKVIEPAGNRIEDYVEPIVNLRSVRGDTAVASDGVVCQKCGGGRRVIRKSSSSRGG